METLNIVTQSFTAIGTVGAVIVSLFLAFRSQRIKARATIDLSTIYLPGDSDPFIYEPSEDIFEVTVTNTGSKPFKIYNIIAYDKQSDRCLIIHPDYNHQCCTKFGFVYSESETGTYIYPKDVLSKSLKDVLNINSINRIKKLRFFAKTNLGQKIPVIPSKNFRQDCSKLFSNIEQ